MVAMKPYDGPEKEFQASAEKLLTAMGYWRRTQNFIMAGRPSPLGRPCKGWFVHVHRTRQNPILLDLLILGNDGRYLELELKTKGGRLSPHQQALIDRGGVLCWNLDEVQRAVEGWQHGE